MRVLPLVLLLGCTAGSEADPSTDVADDTAVTDTGSEPETPTGWSGLPELDDAIKAVMARDHVPGVSACIVAEGDIAWCGAYGLSDVESGRGVHTGTRFLLASVSKAVVGVAMVAAWEAGRLDLDADIDAVLPFHVDHPEAPSAPITARMLAAHVSGIKDNWSVMDAAYADDSDSPIPLSTWLEDYLVPGRPNYSATKNFAGEGPEDVYRYSNTGAALAALVVQEAVDQPFEDWCAEAVFEPLGMDGASWFLEGMDRNTLAVPHTWRNGSYRVEGHYGFPDWPSGQLRATAPDMARLLSMFLNGGEDVLSPAGVAELRRVQYPSIDDTQGLTWYAWEADGATVWGHEGGEVGASTEIAAWVEDGVGTVILMNGEGRTRTLEDIRAAMRGAVDAL